MRVVVLYCPTVNVHAHVYTYTHPQPSHSWGKRAAHNRAQIVYYIAENLELRHDEVAQRIANMTGEKTAFSAYCLSYRSCVILFVLQVVMLRTAGERWTFPFRGCSTGGPMLTSMGDRCR